jgi:hypothetical protein
MSSGEIVPDVITIDRNLARTGFIASDASRQLSIPEAVSFVFEREEEKYQN